MTGSALCGPVEADTESRAGDWRSLGLMQLLKRATKRRNSTSASGYGLDLAIARLTNAGTPPLPCICLPSLSECSASPAPGNMGSSPFALWCSAEYLTAPMQGPEPDGVDALTLFGG